MLAICDGLQMEKIVMLFRRNELIIHLELKIYFIVKEIIDGDILKEYSEKEYKNGLRRKKKL